MSRQTTVHFSGLSSSGTYTTKPFEVSNDLNRLLTDTRTLWAFSAMPKSKWKVKGVPAAGDLI